MRVGSTGLLLLIATSAVGCGRIGFDPGAIDDVATDDGVAVVDGMPGQGLDVDLLAWFKFEPGANFLRDEVTGALATCASCPTAVAGQVGGAAHFDGTACVRLLDRPALRVDNLTMASWLRPTTLGQGHILSRPLDGETGTQDTWLLYQQAPDVVSYGLVGSGGNVGGQSPAIAAGAWSHIALTHQGAANSVYLNGVSNGLNASAVGNLTYSDDDVWIGCDLDVGVLEDFFAGDLDEVKIYGRGLSAAEVATDATP